MEFQVLSTMATKLLLVAVDCGASAQRLTRHMHRPPLSHLNAGMRSRKASLLGCWEKASRTMLHQVGWGRWGK